MIDLETIDLSLFIIVTLNYMQTLITFNLFWGWGEGVAGEFVLVLPGKVLD